MGLKILIFLAIFIKLLPAAYIVYLENVEDQKDKVKDLFY